MSGDSSVMFFDLWMTLIYSLPRDPILDLQQILGYEVGKSEGGNGSTPVQLNPLFAQACLTTDISDEAAFLACLGAKFGIELTEEMRGQAAHLWAAERDGVRFYPETIEVLAELKRQGKRLGLISNLWPFPAHHIFETLGLGAYFEHRIYSFAEGAAKPDGKIFRSAMDCFGVTAGQCVMVGDSPSSDVGGAFSVGMPAILINRSGKPVVCPNSGREIVSLRQLLPAAT
jgi:HAD superfamily hydrolase (TIGR01509 family)